MLVGDDVAGRSARRARSLRRDRLSLEPASLQVPASWRADRVLPSPTIPPPSDGQPIVSPSSVVATPDGEAWRRRCMTTTVTMLDDRRRSVGEHLGEGNGERRGVRPYGGGHPDDWPWGCGGSPFRNGPGHVRHLACRPDLECGRRRHGDAPRGHRFSPQIWNETDDGQGNSRASSSSSTTRRAAACTLSASIRPVPATRCTPGTKASRMGSRRSSIRNYLELRPSRDRIRDGFSSEQRRVHYRSNLHSGELNILKCYNNRCGSRSAAFATSSSTMSCGSLTIRKRLDPLAVTGPAAGECSPPI